MKLVDEITMQAKNAFNNLKLWYSVLQNTNLNPSSPNEAVINLSMDVNSSLSNCYELSFS